MNLYQFTHRTFLEYFTALYLFRINPKPTELLSVLRPRIAKREWDVVAQLAFHIASREVEGAGDDLLSGLVEASHSQSASETSFLSFAGRCLEFVSCSPKVSREVAVATVNFYLSWSSKLSPPLPDRSPKGAEADDLVGNLLFTGPENRKTVAETIEGLLREKSSEKNETDSALAIEAAMTLTTLTQRRSGTTQITPEMRDYWTSLSRKIVDSVGDKAKIFMRKSLPVARAAYATGFATLEQLVDWHGPKVIFRKVSSLTHTDAWPSIGYGPVYQIIAGPYSAITHEALIGRVAILEGIGAALIRCKTPWTARPDFTDSIFTAICGPHHGPPPTQLTSLSPEALFGGFVLAAATVESFENTKATPVITKHLSEPDARWGFLSSLRRTLLGRLVPPNSEDLQAELKAAIFTETQTEFAVRWATRKMNLVRHHGKKSSPGRRTE